MSTLDFWCEDFGNEYHKRNTNIVQNNYVMFSKIFYANHDVYPRNIVEFGAGIGQNLLAIKKIFPFARLTALEINKKACDELKKIHGVKVINKQFDYLSETFDLVLCKGILIHIPPEELNIIYDVIYKAANKYILICEYYNPVPVEVKYRGHESKLWKRDFAGEFLTLYSDCKLLDYGFVYHKDEYPEDDLNWFLLEKI